MRKSRPIVICMFGAKPHELNDECQRITYVNDEVGSPMRIENVPVIYNDKQIGTATITDDGAIYLTMTTPNETGMELARSIQDGFVAGLSIKPIVEPARPALIPPRPWFNSDKTRYPLI